ncbi:hypothetical protein [Oryzomicrobium sp.]|uniref:hypothetical protein n=1 Tax=Oryzomicrobium sp. TaxID=1911578 RepID=UPI0025E82810|nr:hypothetical protein [Oryzomicrobium sp.]MCE1242099.1 hypothetical protein [Oryzomicrobium sp.]
MRNFFSVTVSVVLMLFILAPARAQMYVPIDPAVKSKSGEITASTKNLLTKRLGLDSISADVRLLSTLTPDKAAVFPECSPVPTTNDVSGSFDYKRVLLASSAAVKLGVPVANVTATGNQMVLVQDYSRTKECLATDSQTRLLYGQTIRTVITIANFDSQANLSLPAIAANATIGGKSNSVQVQIFGFSNPQIPTLIAGISGKELNVETYGEFAKIHSDLIKLTADAATTPSMARLGIVASEEQDNLRSNVASAFALQQIKDGRSCNDAKAKYKQSSDPSISAIDQTYGLVIGGCSSAVPSSQQKDKASDYLKGIQVKYSIF